MGIKFKDKAPEPEAEAVQPEPVQEPKPETYKERVRREEAANPWINRPIEQPKLIRSQHEGKGGDGDEYSHPAYGQIMVSNVQGGRTALYGSDFYHGGYVSLTITRSTNTRNLSRDWPHAREELIEVHMSHAQWAHFVSSQGLGWGTQCTIDHVDRVPMPRIPLRDTKALYEQEAHESIKNASTLLRELMTSLEGGELAGLSGVKRAAVLEKVKKAQGELTSHLPFIAESFDRHVENTKEKAKIEIHATIESALVQRGLHAIGQDGHPALSLPSPADYAEDKDDGQGS